MSPAHGFTPDGHSELKGLPFRLDAEIGAEISMTFEIKDRATYDRLIAASREIEGEVIGGRWDGLRAKYTPPE